MSSPKKKLPTGPIQIHSPTPSIPVLEDAKPESRKLENRTIEADKTESTITQQTTHQAKATKTQKKASQKLRKQKATNQKTSFAEASKPEPGKQGTGEGDAISYKKVAMRLTESSVNHLKQLRITEGIPAEIIVDTLIATWDAFSPDLRQTILQQAKAARIQRLLAGQQKALQTTQAKLTEL